MCTLILNLSRGHDLLLNGAQSGGQLGFSKTMQAGNEQFEFVLAGHGDEAREQTSAWELLPEGMKD